MIKPCLTATRHLPESRIFMFVIVYLFTFTFSLYLLVWVVGCLATFQHRPVNMTKTFLYLQGIPLWMAQFTTTPLCWDGVSLKEPAVQYFRNAVYDGRASLIDLRNYIFIRQWQMLDNMHRSWDTTHKILPFVFKVIKEMKILQVKSYTLISPPSHLSTSHPLSLFPLY